MDSGEGGAFLQESGVVDNQYPVGAAELFSDVGLQVIADVVGVPAGAGEQVLQAVGGGVAGVFGELVPRSSQKVLLEH